MARHTPLPGTARGDLADQARDARRQSPIEIPIPDDGAVRIEDHRFGRERIEEGAGNGPQGQRVESPKVTTRTAGAVPDIVVVQTRFDPEDVAAPPPAVARSW